MKKAVWLILVLIFILIILSSCSSQNSGTSSYSSYNSNGYSQQYRTDSEYRNNVDSVADTYGKNSKEIDRTIQRVVNGR